MNTEQIRNQLDRYLSFLEQDSNNINLVCQTSQLYMQLGELSHAKELLNKSLNKSPDDGALLFNYSSILLAENSFEDAIAVLNKLNNKLENNAIKYNLGYALLHSYEFKDAQALFEEIINSEEAPADTGYWLGRCCYHTGDIFKAQKHLSEHVEKNPQNVNSLATLAMLNMDMEELEQARKLAESALSIDENSNEALITMGNIYLEQQDDDEAFKFFSKASNLQPESGRAWSGLGLTNMMKLDIPTAINDLKKATEYMPQHLGTWHALAWAQIVSNDIDSAKLTFENCLDVDRNFGETHGGLAVIDVMQNNKDAAKEKIKRALKLDKQSFSANFAQSLLLQDSKPEEAQKIIEHIMNTNVSGEKTLKETIGNHLKKMNRTKH